VYRYRRLSDSRAAAVVEQDVSAADRAVMLWTAAGLRYWRSAELSTVENQLI
jgi:hypothetical protein